MKRIIVILILGTLLVGCAQQTTGPTATPSQTRQPEETLIPENIPWWKEAVFYEIFVRSFYDSDGNGIGDFNGITQKLDYLNDGDPETKSDLGITAIWLMPIHPSSSYHGYDVINYYGINHDYGTKEDFQNLLAEAHKRGIKVIIDLVLNHTSSLHPFFIDAVKGVDSEYHSWYIWSEVNHGAGWHTATVGSQEMYYYGYFCSCMPDLNYSNIKVTEQMENVARYWLEDIGVDGFRVDAAKHLIEEGEVNVNSPATHEWFRNFYIFYKDLHPSAYTVGEVASSDARLVSTYTGTQFDQIFNFEMASGVVNSVNGEATSSIKSAVTFTLDDMPDWNFSTFLTNHDQDRVMSVLGGSMDKAKNAAFILLTSPGTPYIYYGEEIGMQGRKPDENIRRPMQWSSDPFGGFSTVTPWEDLDPAYTEINVQSQFGAQNSLLSAYRNLIGIRMSHPALSAGEYIPVDSTSNGVYAYIRRKGDETMLLVVNLTKNLIIDYALGTQDTDLEEAEFAVSDILSGVEGSKLVIKGGSFKAYKPLEQLDPYTGYIFEFVK